MNNAGEPSFQDLAKHVSETHLNRYRELSDKPAELALLLYDHASAEEQADELATMIALSSQSKYEWDTVNQIAQRALNTGQPLPQNLADWVSDVLAGRRRRPSKGSKTIARDMIFCAAVEHLRTQFGLTPTRSSATEAWSACDVVAEASGYSYKTIERAWGLRDS